MDISRLIDVIYQIIGGGTVGIITYWVSSKLCPISIKKDALVHILEYELAPIQKIIRPVKSVSIDELISDVEKIDEIMEKNPFDIPPLHKIKIDNLIRLIKLYKTNDFNKKVFDKKIRIEYSSYVSMFNIQCNYVKKQLGYPYSNFYDFLRYETGSPFITAIFLFIFVLFWMLIYSILFIQNQPIKAFLVLFVPIILFLIFAIIYRIVKNHGGIRAIINNFKYRKKN